MNTSTIFTNFKDNCWFRSDFLGSLLHYKNQKISKDVAYGTLPERSIYADIQYRISLARMNIMDIWRMNLGGNKCSKLERLRVMKELYTHDRLRLEEGYRKEK